MMNYKNAFRLKGTQPNWGVGRPAIPTRMGRGQIVNGTLTPIPDNQESYVSKGYSYNDLIFMCVNLIVEKAILAPWSTYEVVDEESYAKAKALRKQFDKPGNIREYKKLMNKALKPANDENLKTLLEYPNEEDTLAKHHSTLWRYKLVTGGYYELWYTPGEGLRQGLPTEWTVLPSQYMQILTNRAVPLRVTGYELIAGGYGIDPYTKEEILHEAYPSLDWSFDGQHLYGMSPIKASLRRTNRNNASQDNSTKAMQNGGKRGITYLDLPDEVLKNMDINGDFATEQTNAMKESYEAMLNGSQSAGLTSFSGYKVGFTEIGISPADLQQMETEKWDFRMIASSYGVPSELLNDPDNKTMANRTEAEKALTLRCAIPLLNDREASINRKLRQIPEYANRNVVVSYDLSVYSELEENKKDQVEYLSKAWWIKPNRKQEIMGETVDEDPLLNKYYVPTNMVTLEELNVSGEEPNDLNTDITNLNNQNLNDYGADPATE